MRSSRFLLSARNKFSGNSTSPRRMPDSTACVLPSPFVHRSVPIKKNFSSAPSSVLGLNQKKGLLEKVSDFSVITVNSRRTFNKDPDLPTSPDLNVFHFKKFLRMKAVDYEETHSALTIRIPKRILDKTLEETTSPEDITTPTVYINKKTGNFVIPRYGITGGWSDFELLIVTWLKNRNLKKSDVKHAYPSLTSITDCISPSLFSHYNTLNPVEGISAQEFRDLLKNFRLLRRDFDARDFARLEARVNADLTEVYFPVRFTTGCVVGFRKLCLEDGEISEVNLPLQSKNCLLPFPHGLYDAERVCANACIIVGSILDSLALSSRTRIPVITLPDWTNLHPDHLPFLHQFQTIYIWLSNDVHGSHNSKVFSQKIEDKRCRIVSCQFPTPLESVRKKLDVKEILESSRSNYHEYLTTFENLRDNVYLEFLQADELLGVKWKRYEQMNSILGGFRRGELTIFSGRTGSGKTTFLSEYSLDLCMQGVNTLWCSFEVKNIRLLKMMLKQFSLINIDDNLQDFNRVADKFSRLPLYLTDFHGSQQIHRVQDAMSHAVYVHDISHIIVDNMQFMLGSASNLDKFHVQDNTIAMFRKFATSHNCHVTLVIHPRKEDEELLTSNSIFGGAKATQEADNVLLLQEEPNLQSFFKKKSIQVVKNRYAGDLGTVPLVFTKPILTFSKKTADQFKRQVKRKPVTLITEENGEISKEILIEPDVDTHQPKSNE